MRLRAGIVVTGTEVLTGRVADANGPWLAETLRGLGVDVGRVVVVGDRPDDLASALHHLAADHPLVLTTGGLGPTADDLTAAVVAQVQGRPLRLDPDLEREIEAIVAGIVAARGWSTEPGVMDHGTRKQAMVPEGADPLPPTGTAPGLVVPPTADGGALVVVLPGPPGELRAMWPSVVAHPAVRALLADAPDLREQTVRIWGPPEAELAAVLRAHEEARPGALHDLEVTTCLRQGELEVVTRYSPAAQPAYDALLASLQAHFGAQVYSTDGRTLDEIVATTLLDAGATIATTESCTAGLLAGRIADRAGSSAYLLGGLVTYSNEAKETLAGVPHDLLVAHGAVSAPVARAMADGARTRTGASVGVGITGVAGPGGGTPEKPVGLVHLCVTTAERALPARVVLGGDRSTVRQRSVVTALHLVREILAGGGDPA